VASGTYTISGGGGGGAGGAVNLSSAANVNAFVNDGSTVANGGMDGLGNAYSATLLGSSIVWNGNTYSLLAAGVADGVASRTITLPAGSFSTISLLGTGVSGNQTSQTFTVNYTDGSQSTFTQSLSDWFTPQNYSGESKVLQMAYRVMANGAPDNRTFYLYGYSFALNSAKTVASIVLPANTHVIILAIDLSGGASPPPPVAATPTFSPAPGTVSAGQPVSLSDTTSGAAIHYTLDSSTPTASSTLYSGPITLNSTTTIKAIAVASGFTNSAVASGTYTISGGGGGGTPGAVNLSSAANVVAFVNDGTAVPGSGMDGVGNVYSATLLGSSVVWNGNTYSLLGAGVPDAVANKTITLPAGNFSTLSFLATAVDGNHPSQVFTVNYTDGSQTTFTQSLSDWSTPQNYPGESKAVTMAYRVMGNGALDNRTFYLYGYSFALNSAKTVASIVLPPSSHVIILAIDVK
jgi:hypothetical protein